MEWLGCSDSVGGKTNCLVQDSESSLAVLTSAYHRLRNSSPRLPCKRKKSASQIITTDNDSWEKIEWDWRRGSRGRRGRKTSKEPDPNKRPLLLSKSAIVTSMFSRPTEQQQGRPMAHLRESCWVQEARQESVLCNLIYTTFLEKVKL